MFEKKLIIKGINNYINQNNNVKVFVDYHGESSKYIHKIKAEKKIYWSHFPFEKRNNKKRERFRKRLNNYDCIVTICDEMEKEIIDKFPELKEKVLKIYNFIDYENIEKELEENVINKEEEKMLKEKYCISIGRLTKQKDHKTIIKAFEILKNRGIKEKLYIIGSGDEKIELKKMIEEKKLEEVVFLLGYKANPYIWIKNSDIFIHSAIFEGFGLVLLEAMYLNKPIISSNFRVGAREIIEKENCGELFEIGNEKELAEKVEKLLLNENRQKTYIENYYKVIKKYSKEKGINNYKKFLESI